jgi:hypothetical protein
MAGVFTPYEFPYETVATGQTGQVLGGTGAIGDYVHRLIVNVSTAATSTVALLDGATSISIMSANTAIGTYSIELNMRSASGAWSVTTGAGASVIAVGRFSA